MPYFNREREGNANPVYESNDSNSARTTQKDFAIKQQLHQSKVLMMKNSLYGNSPASGAAVSKSTTKF